MSEAASEDPTAADAPSTALMPHARRVLFSGGGDGAELGVRGIVHGELNPERSLSIGAPWKSFMQSQAIKLS